MKRENAGLITQPLNGRVRIKRRNVSSAMAKVAKRLTASFDVPVEQAGSEGYYLVNHLTGKPIVRK